MPTKLQKMTRFLPGLYKPQTNVYIRGLLEAWAEQDDLIYAAIKQAKNQIYVKYAGAPSYLDALGSNVGVFRPALFNLTDDVFRQLIPLLSFAPKQVAITIRKVLAVFFGENNPRVGVFEIRPNVIDIYIPSTVPALRRTLKGSHHFHNYSGVITSVDDLAKELVIDIDGDSKSLKEDECAGAKFGQNFLARQVLSNSAGTTGVTLQFSAGDDLSGFVVGTRFNMALPRYPGSFMKDNRSTFTVTKERGVLGQSISIGQILPTVLMQDASGITNTIGKVVFDYGRSGQEGPINYYGRPNNSTLFLDPTYAFTKNHSLGEIINVIKIPYVKPEKDGSDFAIYLVGITAARMLAQQIVESLVAAGVVINWHVTGPVIEY